VRLGYEIISNVLTVEEISNRLQALGDGYSTEDVDWENCYEGWTEELRYLLFRYDEHVAKQKGEKINDGEWNKIWSIDHSRSIEHIEPQSSGSKLVHHLGNLTMLPPGVNSSLRDRPPKEKARIYRQCGICGTRALADELDRGSWDEAAILRRATQIQEFVRAEWSD